MKILQQSDIFDNITIATLLDAYWVNHTFAKDLQDNIDSLEDFERKDLEDCLAVMGHIEYVYEYFTGVKLTNGLG
jgi:hypothetical protein